MTNSIPIAIICKCRDCNLRLSCTVCPARTSCFSTSLPDVVERISTPFPKGFSETVSGAEVSADLILSSMVKGDRSLRGRTLHSTRMRTRVADVSQALFALSPVSQNTQATYGSTNERKETSLGKKHTRSKAAHANLEREESQHTWSQSKDSCLPLKDICT